MRLGTTSLLGRLIVLVGCSLLLVLVVEGVSSYFVTLNISNLIFDRWLLDSAQSIAEDLTIEDGRPVLREDDASLHALTYDSQDRTFLQIGIAGGALLLDRGGMPVRPFDKQAVRQGPAFENSLVEGVPVRAVTIARRIEGFDVWVRAAETLNKRQTMASSVAAPLLMPKALLLFGGLALISLVLVRALHPLQQLMGELSARSPTALEPIRIDGLPLEVAGLVASTNALFSQVDEAIAARERFIANIAHQIRTPLAGIKLQSELSLRRDAPQPVLTSLAQITRAADRMTHLTSQLLVLARAEAALGRGPQMTETDLAEVVAEAVADAQRHQARTETALHCELPAAPVLVDGERTLLHELLVNLIDNALRYAYSRVVVSLEVDPTSIRIAVEDDGPGVAPEHRTRIFDRFYRGSDQNNEGTGLGLAIVGDIARAHGGGVRLDARPTATNRARFVVTLPARPDAISRSPFPTTP